MLILQWLFKNANDQTYSHTTSSKQEVVTDEEVKSQDIVLFGIFQRKSKARKKARLSSKIFNILSKKDIAKDYFYSTLQLKRLGSCHRRQHFIHCMKMKKESLTRKLSFNRKADSATKVIPVTDAVGTTSSAPCPTNGNEKSKGDKIKTISKMKELLRWAAAAKSDKGAKYLGRKVLQLRSRSALKAVPDDDQLSNDSPKISFRWDVESCSTLSSAYSAISVTSSTKNDYSIINSPSSNSNIDQGTRKGNWVTTDSEFVVLELEL